MSTSIEITALNHNTIEVSLPEGIGSAFPIIPNELHGRKIPTSVLSWLLETDEVGYMIQETLQAPTRSMCRIFYTGVKKVPTAGHGNLNNRVRHPREEISKGNKVKKPLTPILKSPAKGIKKDKLKGHSSDDFIEGLPKGILLPASLENHPNLPSRVKKWIEDGREVQKWLIAEELSDINWLPL